MREGVSRQARQRRPAVALRRLAAAGAARRDLRAAGRAAGPAGAGPDVRAPAALLDAGRRAGLLAGHRLPRPRSPVAADLWRPHRLHRRLRRRLRRLPRRLGARASPPAISAAGPTASCRASSTSGWPFRRCCSPSCWSPCSAPASPRSSSPSPSSTGRASAAWCAPRRWCRRRMDYVENARIAGFGRCGIMLREVLPNVLPAIVALLSLEMGIAIIVEAILSFVNLSISTDDPDLGRHHRRGPPVDPPGLVGAGLSAGRAVPHRALLQPARRGAEGALRSGAAMSAPPLSTSPTSAPRCPTARRILRDVSLSIQPGEVRALVGESGAGKSMIGKAVLGVLPKSVRSSRAR